MLQEGGILDARTWFDAALVLTGEGLTLKGQVTAWRTAAQLPIMLERNAARVKPNGGASTPKAQYAQYLASCCTRLPASLSVRRRLRILGFANWTQGRHCWCPVTRPLLSYVPVSPTPCPLLSPLLSPLPGPPSNPTRCGIEKILCSFLYFVRHFRVCANAEGDAVLRNQHSYLLLHPYERSSRLAHQAFRCHA